MEAARERSRAVFRRLALNGVRDGELDRRSTGSQLDRAERWPFGREFGLILVLPAYHQPPWRLDLDDLAGVLRRLGGRTGTTDGGNRASLLTGAPRLAMNEGGAGAIPRRPRFADQTTFGRATEFPLMRRS
jgi:hypothetical protein